MNDSFAGGNIRCTKGAFSPGTSQSIPQVHLFDTEYGPHVLMVNGSRIYRVADEVASTLRQVIAAGDAANVGAVLEEHGLEALPYITDTPLPPFPLKTISLAVAQKCNLGCVYCYAQKGTLKEDSKNMTLEVALAAVDLLMDGITEGERATVVFLGGEPLMNRPVLYAATEYAAKKSADKGIKVSFSITSNGTMVTPEDGEFFEKHGFAVTISLDGVGESHDRLRPFLNGSGSYNRIIERVRPLLKMQSKMQVSTRVTVTPKNLRLRKTLDEIIAIGFHSVGFSPMLSSPDGRDQMNAGELETMLAQMADCGREFERRLLAGQYYPFSNIVTALEELRKGNHRPYPCGAGVAYLGVSAQGGLFPCHRFVDDGAWIIGNLYDKNYLSKQKEWLAEWHVHRQKECRSCWARYLCGGGCYYEVVHRGRPACDYIRGWLHYCLQAYVRLLEKRPDFFEVNQINGQVLPLT